jgi:branched-chain amino acid transport system permease protein
MDKFFIQTINGLAYGMIYALIASGVTLMWGIMDFINMAHGELYMLGAYAAWLCTLHVFNNFWVSLLVGVAAITLMGQPSDMHVTCSQEKPAVLSAGHLRARAGSSTIDPGNFGPFSRTKTPIDYKLFFLVSVLRYRSRVVISSSSLGSWLFMKSKYGIGSEPWPRTRRWPRAWGFRSPSSTP